LKPIETFQRIGGFKFEGLFGMTNREVESTILPVKEINAIKFYMLNFQHV